MAPLVSVIIPAHNSGSHLRATVESVLAQAHRPLEVLLVDDGSTDGTPALAAGFGAREAIRAPLLPLPGLLQGAMLARRTSFLRVGLFAPEKAIGDFIDWYGRAMLAGLRTRMLPDTVLHRRIHRNNHQRRNRHLMGAGYLQAVKELLDRRRNA